VALADEDASAPEVLLRGIGAEIGIGPIDLTTIYDILSAGSGSSLPFGWDDDAYYHFPAR
jgi:hypothetical protein